ncbi:MAG: hypothetical protein K8W52_26380 [Deltaproteobacteria bacterium]|nr:hypothetical protein [Deltaproteobacteria bacterium]
MRVVRWFLAIAAVLSLVGMFLPAVQVVGTTASLSKRTSVSFYKAFTSQSFITQAAQRHDASAARGIAAALVSEIGPRGGKLTSMLREVRDDLDDYQEVRDVAASSTLGTVVTIVGWLMLALLVAGAGYAVAALSGRRLRRRTSIIFAALALVAAIIGVAVYAMAGEAVALVNDEIGRTVFERGAGAALLMIATVVTLALTTVQAIAPVVPRGARAAASNLPVAKVVATSAPVASAPIASAPIAGAPIDPPAPRT